MSSNEWERIWVVLLNDIEDEDGRSVKKGDIIEVETHPDYNALYPIKDEYPVVLSHEVVRKI